MKRTFACSLFLAFFTFSLASTAHSQAETIWEIGKPDQSIREFSAAPSSHVVFQVGKSDWAKDWPATEQTGSAYEIRFNLDAAAPQGVFTLKVSLLTGYFGVPDLQLEINGHKGIFYVRSKPLYTGDSSAWGELNVELPTQYLTKGENNLVLSPAKMQAAGVTQPAGAAPTVESIRYDYLALTNDPYAIYSVDNVSANVVPTVFYLQKQGELVELVNAYLQFDQANPAGRAILTLGGKSYTANIPANDGFGETLVEFSVPEWQGAESAKLQVAAGSEHTFNLSLIAERKWTLFLVPHTHVDIGYTDYQGKVAENQAETLLEAADLIKQYPDFRFATDGSWNLQQLINTRPQPERDRILDLIRTNKIEVPADYFNLLTGYASLETFYRSFYYSKSLSREFHLPFNYATTTDVPSYTGAYPSVLASAGIRYWVVGANQDRAPVLMHEQWNEKSPFWWQGPDGKKVLFWYSWSYAQIGRYLSLDPTNERIRQSLPLTLAPYDKPDYKPDAILIYGAQDENTDLHPHLASFVPAWNQSYAYPRLRYATFADFMTYIDQHFGAKLPTYVGDMGPYWEDGIGADAYYAAEDRQNQSDALSAEVVSTTANTMNPDFHLPKAEMADAWNNILLFAEHTWGAGNSISQPDSQEAVKQLAVKDNFATQARFELEDITNRALYQLARHIQIPSGTMIVFNGLSFQRDALIEADLRRNQQLVDLTTHQDVPFEVISDKENFLHVRFLARDLPPVGYKCFQTRTAATPAATAPSPDKNPVIENNYYRITIDAERGAVQSIFDKQLQREIVDTHSPYRFGQYLYVTGGDPRGNGQTRMIHPNRNLPAAELTIHPAAGGEYLGALKTPWGYSIKLRSSAFNTPAVALEILLYDNEKKIEFRYAVNKTYTTEKEAAYFAFPAAVSQPQFTYATQQGWVDPSRDMFKGASLEWFSVQKWMAVRDLSLTLGIVPLDASLASFGDINRGAWPEDFQPKSSTIFSYAMNNYWHTNYRGGQGGLFNFRYVISSAASFDPAALSRLGWQSMEAPAIDFVANQDKVGNPNEPLPPEGTSFLAVSAPNVVLVTWKLAEDGNGTILRLQETGGQAVEATVRFPHVGIHSANLCNSVEDNLQALPVTASEIHLTFHPHEVLTVRVRLGPAH